MRCANRSNDRGSAAIEFVALGLVLIVPLVYLILVVAQVQAGTLAAEGAARQAARDLTQTTARRGIEAAERDIALVMDDFGFEHADVDWGRTCVPDCVTAGAVVAVNVTVRVPLPLIPPVLNIAKSSSIVIDGHATQLVSQFAGAQ